MKEWIELRISDPAVLRRLPAQLGRDLDSAKAREMWKRIDPAYPGGVRRIDAPRGSPELDLAFGILREVFGDPYPHYSAWIHRRYTAKELLGAELLRLIVTRAFEPEGESCGTAYDYSTACPRCGAGRTQTSDLHLQLGRLSSGWPGIPRAQQCQIARTIAEEMIVSSRLAALMTEQCVTGVELRPVRGCGDTGKMTPLWKQLTVTGSAGRTVPPTEFGINPFKPDNTGQYRCPLGHVSGLCVLSEVYVRREIWDGSDVASTEDMTGRRAGVLVPSPMVLISQRLYRLLLEHKVKGFEAEVAHLV